MICIDGIYYHYYILWFQFADNADVITRLENENQSLLNHFTPVVQLGRYDY